VGAKRLKANAVRGWERAVGSRPSLQRSYKLTIRVRQGAFAHGAGNNQLFVQ
jgi:hypothetical protein